MNQRTLSVPILIAVLLLFLPAAVPSGFASEMSPAPLPLHVRSFEKDGLLGAEISGTIGYPFNRVEEALTSPAAWCEFIPLVFNIKSCIHSGSQGGTLLTLYIGRKFFDPPEKALQLDYDFRVLSRENGRLRVLLTADEGPHGTRDYRIDVEALPAPDGGTFLRLESSFRPSLRSSFATRIYLSTTGREKVGFSVVGKEGGKPAYVRGTKGIIERNAMRYYLALKAYLDTLEVPEENRFEDRLNAWFDLTQEYPRQLHEMDRAEYLGVKKKERRYQLELQGTADTFQAHRHEEKIDTGQG